MSIFKNEIPSKHLTSMLDNYDKIFDNKDVQVAQSIGVMRCKSFRKATEDYQRRVIAPAMNRFLNSFMWQNVENEQNTLIGLA
jgi:hypothetical protein